ncbi:protein FAM151A [Aplochiton taeniatus]
MERSKESASESDEASGGRGRYLGCLGRERLVMSCVGAGLLTLLIVIVTVTTVVVASNSGSSGPLPSFPTDGDMLDFLVGTGDIPVPDGLLATWYHRANNKSEMNKALKSDVMILEADVTVEGFGTANETTVPIMAHPPDVYSDNSLDQWLEAILDSRKGVKLDFKSLEVVGPSLELLRQKNQTRGINRPVWINADILPGPNVPAFWPVVNGTEFLRLVNQRFPAVTLSPGWKVLYVPQFPSVTYTRRMMEEMYQVIRDVPQSVTFPVLAPMMRGAWQHFSWLLSQSPRFSLTLWQGSVDPSVEDLLFVRDNSNPSRIYYDIYEPVLSQFKQAAARRGRQRRFYPGGDLLDYFHQSDTGTHSHRDSLHIHWFRVTDRASLLAELAAGAGGMLVVWVGSDGGVPMVKGPESSFSLKDCLDLVLPLPGTWGFYLRLGTPDVLEPSLRVLSEAYSRDLLYRPVWVSMEPSSATAQTSSSVEHFLTTVETVFPHVTLVTSPSLLSLDQWGAESPLRGVSQRLALPLGAESLRGPHGHTIHAKEVSSCG